MQIAQVVVKTRTIKEDIFDYAIPPQLLPEIKIGILVEVVFHGRKIEGIIVGLKRSSKIENLSAVLKVIDPAPVIDEIHIRLAKWMADYYLSSLGKTLFENTVPPAKRTIKKSHQSSAPQKFIHITRKPKKYLVNSDFSTRLKFYLKAIEKNLIQNRSIIIAVPDLSLIPFFTKNLKANFSVLHSQMTKTERWTVWDKIRKGQSKIIIGSQSALFAPVQNLGLIIIDQEENETFKNDRSPRFNTADVAESLADLTGASLIIGSLTPRVETYSLAQHGFFKLYKKSLKTKPALIVDMNSEKSAISNTLEKKILNNLIQKKKILLVLNRKGEGTKFSCPDCGWIAACQKCGLPLIPQKQENVCYHCEKKFLPPAACPKCKSIHLKPKGFGTARLKKNLTKIFPQARIIQIEKEIDGQNITTGWDIAVVTSFALKFQLPHLSLVALIDADQSLNLPDFNSSQKSFQTGLKFIRLGEEKIIQTHLPESFLAKSLSLLNYDLFFRQELNERKKEEFPPYVQLTRLEYRHPDKETAQKVAANLYSELSKNSNIKISPPYPPYIEKKLDKFRYQILIKSSPIHLKNSLPPNLKEQIKSLPSGWIIDVDPFSLV